MSDCICGKCPSTFKYCTGDEEEYLCLIDEKQIYIEQRTCIEQIERMAAFALVKKSRDSKPLDEKEKKFIEYNTSYWTARKDIIDQEIARRNG